MNSEFIHGNEAKHIPPACAMDRELRHIADTNNMNFQPAVRQSLGLGVTLVLVFRGKVK